MQLEINILYKLPKFKFINKYKILLSSLLFLEQEFPIVLSLEFE